MNTYYKTLYITLQNYQWIQIYYFHFNKWIIFNKNKMFLSHLIKSIKNYDTNTFSHFNLVNHQLLKKKDHVYFLNTSYLYHYSNLFNSYLYNQYIIPNILTHKNNTKWSIKNWITYLFINKQNLKQIDIQTHKNNNLYYYDHFINPSHLFNPNSTQSTNINSNKSYFIYYYNLINNNSNSLYDFDQKNEFNNNRDILNINNVLIPKSFVLGLKVVLSGKIKKKGGRKTVHNIITGSFSKIYHNQTSQLTAKNKVGTFTIKVTVSQIYLDHINTNNSIYKLNYSINKNRIRLTHLFKLKNGYTSSKKPLSSSIYKIKTI